MSSLLLKKEEIPTFIYLVNAINKEWKRSNPNGSDSKLAKLISDQDSLEGDSRSQRTIKRALNLEKKLTGKNVEDYGLPDRITLEILSCYYFDVNHLKRFKNIAKEYPDEIKTHFEKTDIKKDIIDSIFLPDEKENDTVNNKTSLDTQVKNTDITNKVPKANSRDTIVKRFIRNRKKTVLLLMISLAVLAGIYKTTFRKVSIHSNQNLNITVFKIDDESQKTELGKLNSQNNYTLEIKLVIGKTQLYYFSTDDGYGEEYPGIETIEIPPFWKSIQPIVLSKI